MVKTYRRQTKRGSLKMDYIITTVRRVKDDDAIRKVAKEMNTDKNTLSRCVKKAAVGNQAYWLLGQPQDFFQRRKNHCYANTF